MQTVHLLGSSVMTQRNHILCSTQQYFQKAYKSAVVIVVLIGKQSWTDAKQCVHRWIWYASCSHSNLGLRSLSICRVCEDPKVLAGILLAVNLQEPMAARLKKLLQSQTQPTMFQIHNRKGNAKRKEGTERHPGTHTELRPAPDGFFTISFSDIKRDSWISIILEGGKLSSEPTVSFGTKYQNSSIPSGYIQKKNLPMSSEKSIWKKIIRSSMLYHLWVQLINERHSISFFSESDTCNNSGRKNTERINSSRLTIWRHISTWHCAWFYNSKH